MCYQSILGLQGWCRKMAKTMLSWLFTGGSVSVPKRLMAFLDILALDFEQVGQLMYLLYLEGKVEQQDKLGLLAVRGLKEKGLILYDEKSGEVDFSPLFDQIMILSGESETKEEVSSTTVLERLMKRIEKEKGYFLSPKEKYALSEVLTKYNWDEALIYQSFLAYQAHRKDSYQYDFFAKMLYGAGVNSLDGLEQYLKQLNFEKNKVREVLKRIGKYNTPTVAQEEMYHNWSKQLGFSHEMIILACDRTINADNPSFGYIKKILEDWYTHEIFSKEDLERYEAYKKSTNTSTKTRRETKPKETKNNKFVNSTGYRDFSDLVEW